MSCDVWKNVIFGRSSEAFECSEMITSTIVTLRTYTLSLISPLALTGYEDVRVVIGLFRAEVTGSCAVAMFVPPKANC